jgi:NAD(P)H-dependent FMN reductase
METHNIGVLLGSTRDGRFSEYPTEWILQRGQEHAGIALSRIDLRDHALPFLSDRVNPSKKNGVYEDERVSHFSTIINGCAGFIVVVPEYNHGYPAVLKNAFDHLKGEWARKPICFISYGTYGGVRSVEQLRLVAIDLGMVPLKYAVHITAPWDLRQENGTLKPGALAPYEDSAHTMLTEIAWWTKTLRAGGGAL